MCCPLVHCVGSQYLLVYMYANIHQMYGIIYIKVTLIIFIFPFLGLVHVCAGNEAADCCQTITMIMSFKPSCICPQYNWVAQMEFSAFPNSIINEMEVS